MKGKNILFRFLMTVAVLGLFGLSTAQAQTTPTSFSGDATGVIANANVLGTVTTNVRVAQTGQLPAAGGSLQGDVANANIQLGALGTLSSLTTGVIQTRTSGGAAGGTPNSSQSRATVNNLNLGLLGGTLNTINVTATTVQSTTLCTCGANGPTCSGTTTIENLRVNNVLVTATAIVMPAPNTVIVVPLLDALGIPIGTVTLTLNEQIISGPGDITVNALRIQVTALNGSVTTNIIIAQSHSDITCTAGGNVCTPTTTVTEGDLAPGGIASFGVSSGPGSVTVDHVNAGTGLRSFTVVGTPTNAVVTIPAFTPGTFNPVTATFTVIDPSQPVDFTLRAASSFHSIFIRVRCSQTQACTPTATVTEGDLAPGGIASFGVSSGPGSVTVDHVNAGTGLRSFTVVSATNAVVTIPAFTPGTFNPVTATYTIIDPSQPVDFTLRAASLYHSIFIRVRCSTAVNTFSGRATAVNATISGINAILSDTGPLPATGGFITVSLVSANVLGGALTTGLLTATTQGAGDQSRSQATTENLTLLVGGNIITSDIVAESSQCTCTTGGPICEGSLLGNLRINGVNVAITGQANQVVNLVGGGTIVINEQILTGSGNAAAITANGLHVRIPGVADVIISSAHSDIVCLTQ